MESESVTGVHATRLSDSGPGEPAPETLVRRLIGMFASLRLTLVCLLMLLGALFYLYETGGEAEATFHLVAPFSLLSINLSAAIFTNRTFRRQLPLLTFHLALLAMIILATLGRLTYLRATTELVTGGGGELGLERIEAGRWHRGAMDSLQFENLGFSIYYKLGPRRDKTVNLVRWRDEQGISQTKEIGDQVPLILHGYRIYTSSNKGFSALFRWEPFRGEVQLGSVNFPSYPADKDRQSATWRLGADEVKTSLNIHQKLIDPDADSEFEVPLNHSVTVDLAWRIATIAPGETLLLPTGRLIYVGLTTWMGYNIFYDWTMPWLLAACTLAVLALGWHFWTKFAIKPWRPE
jgi:hypothetical protein